jgi:hypothetical protein
MACSGCKERMEMLRRGWGDQKAVGVVKAVRDIVVVKFLTPKGYTPPKGPQWPK